MSEKTTFAWASIAGADPEPVEVIERDGRKGVLTIGCADPFWLDDESAGVRLDWNTLRRPALIQTVAEKNAAEVRYGLRSAGFHGWRGPR